MKISNFQYALNSSFFFNFELGAQFSIEKWSVIVEKMGNS